jgi:hypothetical protein
LIRTNGKYSALGYLSAIIGIFSTISFFAIIKLYLLVKSDVQEKYFDELRDLEITVKCYFIKHSKTDKIIKGLRQSTLRQEIFLIIFYLFIQLGYSYVAITDNMIRHTFVGLLYDTYNCFFVQILIFLKMNMEFARRLQNHINQVLLNLQKFDRQFDVEDFIKIHRKIKHYLATLNKAFGFIFLMTFLEIYGSMVPQIYKSILTLTNPNFKISLNLIILINLNFIWAMFSYYHLGRFTFECDKMEEEVISNIHRIFSLDYFFL